MQSVERAPLLASQHTLEIKLQDNVITLQDEAIKDLEKDISIKKKEIHHQNTRVNLLQRLVASQKEEIHRQKTQITLLQRLVDHHVPPPTMVEEDDVEFETDDSKCREFFEKEEKC